MGFDHVSQGNVGGRFVELGDPLPSEEEVEDGLELSLVPQWISKEDEPTPLNFKLPSQSSKWIMPKVEEIQQFMGVSCVGFKE